MKNWACLAMSVLRAEFATFELESSMSAFRLSQAQEQRRDRVGIGTTQVTLSHQLPRNLHIDLPVFLPANISSCKVGVDYVYKWCKYSSLDNVDAAHWRARKTFSSGSMLLQDDCCVTRITKNISHNHQSRGDFIHDEKHRVISVLQIPCKCTKPNIGLVIT